MTKMMMKIITRIAELLNLTKSAREEEDEGCEFAVEAEHIIVHPDLSETCYHHDRNDKEDGNDDGG